MLDAGPQNLFATARDVLLEELPDAWAIYIYGSFANGTASSRSDLDLAVLLPPRREISDRYALTARVASRTRRDVDLVNLRKAGNVLRREVLDSGLPVYVSAPDFVLEWEASAMTRYAHHREEIRDLLDDFEQTGIGYHR